MLKEIVGIAPLGNYMAGRAPTWKPALAAVDGVLWVPALILGTTLRYDFGFATNSAPRLGIMMLTAFLANAVWGSVFGLYTGGWRFGSFDEAFAIALTVGSVTVTLMVANVLLGRPSPMSGVVVAGTLCMLAIAGLRWIARVRRQRQREEGARSNTTRVVVFGAGDGGSSVISSMLRDPAHTYLPVALLDDDPAKARLRISGVAVMGRREALAQVAESTRATMLLVAIPSADADLVREMNEQAHALDLEIRLLPPVRELFDRVIGVSDIRKVSYVDLLGRREVEVDTASIALSLTGKRVLVTGAGGSIGSELCRQLMRYEPASLAMLDRDESALHATQLSMDGRALLDDRNLVVADIRDRQRMAAVMAEHHPEVVFHAAALKHLPLLEMYPQEAVKTNVWGTWNVLESAADAGVELFINISTDKAADPISVLGYSKRVAERLASWFDTHNGGSYMSVRFGNVLGSRGSVITTFAAQVSEGRDLTVTHPDVSRYFMTIEEAVRLVFQAGASGSGGEVLVLDMGLPVKIAEIAQHLIDASGSSSRITYTGLRSGEKLHEVLLGERESDFRPAHPYVSHVPVPCLPPTAVVDLLASPCDDDVIQALATAVRMPVILPEPRKESPSLGEAEHGPQRRRYSDPRPVS